VFAVEIRTFYSRKMWLWWSVLIDVVTFIGSDVPLCSLLVLDLFSKPFHSIYVFNLIFMVDENLKLIFLQVFMTIKSLFHHFKSLSYFFIMPTLLTGPQKYLHKCLPFQLIISLLINNISRVNLEFLTFIRRYASLELI
jgi:hypothetical protein